MTMKKRKDRKMISVTVSFWTNGVTDATKKILKDWKVAHASGVIYVTKGPDWKRVAPVHFHRESEIPSVIEDVLTEAGVILIEKKMMLMDSRREETV